VTVDGESVGAGTVTLRDRDTLSQERVSVDGLPELIASRLLS
jgi:glycyl-tRNA synthetase (class II)